MKILQNCILLIERLIAAGIWLYTLSLLVLVMLWLFLSQHHTLIALTNIFALYFFLPLPLLLLLVFWQRSRVLRGVVMVLPVMFGLLFLPRMLPVLSRPTVQPAVRVVSFNQLFDNRDVARSVEVLVAQKADIIALQELVPEMAEALQQLQDQYPYQVLEPRPAPGGLGILSRYPLEHVEALPGVHALQAHLTIAGQSLVFINAHPSAPTGRIEVPLPFTQMRIPSFDPSRRDRELEHLLEQVRTSQETLIVAGDLNTSDREYMYQRFDALLHDAYAETRGGLGYTFPNSPRWWLPRVRIDYIWARGNMLPVDAQISCEARGSDHCMLIADLGLNDTAINLSNSRAIRQSAGS